MKVYLFDINTKRYIKEAESLTNPENPNNPHIQGNAATIKPPECGESEAPYYDRKSGTWIVKPCYIGKKAVHTESKFIETVTYDGDLKEGWQYVTDETAEEIENSPLRYEVKNGVLSRLSDDEYNRILRLNELEIRKSEKSALLCTKELEHRNDIIKK